MSDLKLQGPNFNFETFSEGLRITRIANSEQRTSNSAEVVAIFANMVTTEMPGAYQKKAVWIDVRCAGITAPIQTVPFEERGILWWTI